MEAPVRSMYMDIVERKTLGKNLYRVTIAANEKVRQPPELDFDGISTDNYARNPVVMWAHDTVGRSPSGGLPIGRTLSLNKTSKGGVVADFEFLSEDPFAQRVKNAWDKGFLKAASISWIPLSSAPTEGGGWRDTKSDLLEWSIVSIPADPDAVREAHRRMMDSFINESGSRSLEPDLNTRDGLSPQSQESLALSPDDYDDLTAALALIRDVVEGVEASAVVGKNTFTPEDDLGEIGERLVHGGSYQSNRSKY